MGREMTFTQYRRKQIAELRPYEPGETLSDRVSISPADKDAGSPKLGDMIARNPKNHDDQWLVAADYFADNFEPVSNPNGNGYPKAIEALKEAAERIAALRDPAINGVWDDRLKRKIDAVLSDLGEDDNGRK